MVKVNSLRDVVVAETALSDVDGIRGQLSYRGHAVGELVEKHAFEEIAHLLWTGRFPSDEEREQVRRSFAAGRAWAEESFAVIDALNPQVNATDAVAVGLCSLRTTRGETSPDEVTEAPMHCGALQAFILRHYTNICGLPYQPCDKEVGYAKAFLSGISPLHANDSACRTLEAYFILTMEHSLNASTFSARVTTSTRATMNRALVSAIATMSGPLHGGAPSEVIDMLEDIGMKDRAASWLEERLMRGERIMGFGHRVYRTMDPRADALKRMMFEIRAEDEDVQLAAAVEDAAGLALAKHKPGRELHPNVEFWAAALLRSLRIPKSMYTATFCVSRVVGWTAHILEQRSCDTLIRPKGVYAEN